MSRTHVEDEMETTTQAIARAENSARHAFKSFDALSAAHRAQQSPPDPSVHNSIGELMVAAARFDPSQVRAKHSEIEHEFFKSIDGAIAIIKSKQVEAREFLLTADYLEGNGQAPADEALHAYAEQVKAAAKAGANIDPHQLAADIRRNVQGADAELARVLNAWGDKTKAASLVAARTKRFLLSYEMKFDDAAQQKIKHDTAKALFEKRHGVMSHRRRGAI